MAPIVIPDTVKIECEGTVAGRPWVNVFHCARPASFTEEVANGIAGRIRSSFYGEFLDSLSSQWTCTQQTITDISSATGGQYSYTSAVTGTASNELLSPDTALVVTWLTALRGRSYRGRTYLAGFTEASNTSTGRVEAATVTNVNGGCGELLGDMNAAGTEMVVASRTLVESNVITTSRINTVWDRQKRRNYR